MPNNYSSGYVYNLKIPFNKIYFFSHSVDSEIKVIVHSNSFIIYSPMSFQTMIFLPLWTSKGWLQKVKLWVNFTFNVDSLVAHYKVQAFDLFFLGAIS